MQRLSAPASLGVVPNNNRQAPRDETTCVARCFPARRRLAEEGGPPQGFSPPQQQPRFLSLALSRERENTPNAIFVRRGNTVPVVSLKETSGHPVWIYSRVVGAVRGNTQNSRGKSTEGRNSIENNREFRKRTLDFSYCNPSFC